MTNDSGQFGAMQAGLDAVDAALAKPPEPEPEPESKYPIKDREPEIPRPPECHFCGEAAPDLYGLPGPGGAIVDCCDCCYRRAVLCDGCLGYYLPEDLEDGLCQECRDNEASAAAVTLGEE